MTALQQPGSAPTERVPLWKFVVFVVMAGGLDLAKAAALSLIIIGPFAVGGAAGYITYQALQDKIGPTLAQPIATLVGVTAGGLIAATPVDEALEAFGVILAMLIGIAGWIFFSLVLFLLGAFNIRVGGSQHLLTVFVAAGISITPLVDIAPTFTPAIWRILRDLRKREAAGRMEWERRVAAYQAARQQEQQQRAEASMAAQQQEEAAEEAQALTEEPAPALIREKSPPLIGPPAYGF